MALSHSPQIVRDGLVLYLDAANIKSYPGSGTNCKDIVGEKNYILSNGPIFNSENKGSFLFDGIDDNGFISNSNISGLTSFTVNIWHYSNIDSATALTRSDGNAFIIHFKGAGFYVSTSDNQVSDYLRWQTPPSAFQWNMITGTWDGNNMKIYLNGLNAGQNGGREFTGNGILKNIDTIRIGYNFNSNQPFTNGKISIFQLYNKALSENEINQNFNALRGRYGI